MNADAEYHDAVAERYDRSYDPHPGYARWWAQRLHGVGAPAYEIHPRPRKILDVGCGPGRLVEAFLELGHDARGVDHSRAMWEIAGRRVGKGRVHLGGGDRLPYADQTFDLAVVFGVLHHAVGEGYGTAGAIIGEACRVAGEAVFVEPNVLHPYFLATTYAWHGLQERVAGYPRVAHERPFGLGELRARINRAGCQILSSGRVDAQRAYGSRWRLPWPMTTHIYARAQTSHVDPDACAVYLNE